MNGLHSIAPLRPYAQYPDLAADMLNRQEWIGTLLDIWAENNHPFGLWRHDDAGGDGQLYVIDAPDYSYEIARGEEQFRTFAQRMRNDRIDYGGNTWYITDYYAVKPGTHSTENIWALSPIDLAALPPLPEPHEHEYGEEGYCIADYRGQQCDHYNPDFDRNEYNGDNEP